MQKLHQHQQLSCLKGCGGKRKNIFYLIFYLYLEIKLFPSFQKIFDNLDDTTEIQ